MRFKTGASVLGLFALMQSSNAVPAAEAIRLIVKYKHQESMNSLKTTISSYSQLPIKAITPMANGAYSLILNSANHESLELVLERLRKDPTIYYAVKDRVGHFKPVPNPVNVALTDLLSHDTQWDEFSRPAGMMLESKPGLKDGAWAKTTGQSKSPTVIAVLDTGIALNDSLINNLVKNESGEVWGWNFAGNNNDLTDETKSYHGTHVAGTIAGYGPVMTGIGADLKILTAKIPDATGLFYESAVINSIYWSVGTDVPGIPRNPYPAKVLNMSFGVDIEPGREADFCDEALQEAVFYARKKGAVLAVAAGNDNRWEHYNAPGVCNGTIKVASTGPEGLRSYFSNYGPSVTIAAPGGDKQYGPAGGILSTVNPGGGYKNSGFDFYQGTSMATPHVAGVAGLVFAVNNKLNAQQVEQILYTATHDFGQTKDANKSCVGKKPCGHGILDAEYAVDAALANYSVLLSAPRLDVMGLASKGCGNGFKSDSIIEREHMFWIKEQGECQAKKDYQHPSIEQNQRGDIYAYYGSVRYKLESKVYKNCRKVGYDGIGCY